MSEHDTINPLTPPKRNADRIKKRMEREDQNIFARLPSIYAASRTQGQKFLKFAGGLSIVEWRTLWDLSVVGPLTIRELAAIQRADHSLLSRALPEMRKKGYVSMQKDIEDGRQMVVQIEDKGRAAYEKAAPIMAQRRKALRAEFSPEEIEAFVGYLDRFEVLLRTPMEDILEESTPNE